jgi:hypothetical protein
LPAPAQEPAPTPTPARQGQVVTRVDVDILELDVLVLGAGDKPVGGLTKDDFAVRIGGQPQPIEFFDAPASGRIPGISPPPAEEVVAGTTTPAGFTGRTAPHLLFFIDVEQLPVGAVRESAPAIESALRHLPLPVRLSVVSHYGRASTLVWDEESLDRVTAALESVAEEAAEQAKDAGVAVRGVPGGTGGAGGENALSYEGRQIAERQLLDALTSAVDTYRTTGDGRPLADAWRQIGEYVQEERGRDRDLIRALRGVCEEFAGLDGPKTVVLVSRGFERYPGFNLLNAAQSAASAAQTGGVMANPRAGAALPGLPGSGVGGLSATPLPDYDDFVKWISASGITLHFLDPSRGTDLVTAERGAGERFRDLSGERKNLQEAGTNLATVTGGLARLQPGDLRPSLVTFVNATSGAYRLGIRMADVDPRKSYKVDVRVARKGLRVLARSAYRPRLPASAAPAATFEADSQRLRAGVDERRPGSARRAAKTIGLEVAWKGKSSALSSAGKNLYKLDVLIPYDDLRFLPEEETMAASARITVVADSAEGKGRESFSEDLFFSMTGKEYSDAAGTRAERTLTLTLLPGRWNLSVSVTDLLESRSGIARATVVAEP